MASLEAGGRRPPPESEGPMGLNGVGRSVGDSSQRVGRQATQETTWRILSLDLAPLMMKILDFGTLRCSDRISTSLLFARPSIAFSSILTSKSASPTLTTRTSFALGITWTLMSTFLPSKPGSCKCCERRCHPRVSLLLRQKCSCLRCIRIGAVETDHETARL